ncbi:hypothetical protein E2C01_013121 [Portunus trituberculatus]|uniref:Chitin-binding type-2 domain-containing protein n=1 Tax=Portunus trituberculatus TaxID=210409 RepID=A0A5B7DG88_PORTR|nr:hypothetical protein [Portunus trituberculatus]
MDVIFPWTFSPDTFLVPPSEELPDPPVRLLCVRIGEFDLRHLSGRRQTCFHTHRVTATIAQPNLIHPPPRLHLLHLRHPPRVAVTSQLHFSRLSLHISNWSRDANRLLAPVFREGGTGTCFCREVVRCCNSTTPPGEGGKEGQVIRNPQARGFYADPETRCQVFHICNYNTGIKNICPNGTIFSQEQFTCRWWNEVNCEQAESFYELNNQIGVVPPDSPYQPQPQPSIPQTPTPIRPQPPQPVTPVRPIPPRPVTPVRPIPPRPVTPVQPIPPRPVTPVRPIPPRPVTPVRPTPPRPVTPVQPTPPRPIIPVRPTPPPRPITPVRPTPPRPVTPVRPTPPRPVTPVRPIPPRPVTPVRPTPPRPVTPVRPTPPRPVTPVRPTPPRPVTPVRPAPPTKAPGYDISPPKIPANLYGPPN